MIVDNGRTDPRLPCIADPEERSRLVGALSRAPIVQPGQRGTGGWTWPEALAERVRSEGAGPPQSLVDHLLGGRPGELAAADTQFYAFSADGSGQATDLLQMPPSVAVGTAVTDGAWLTPVGWRAVDRPPDGLVRAKISAHRLSDVEASQLAGRLCQDWFRDAWSRGVESTPTAVGPRPARVYDSRTAKGRAAFSPTRRRVLGSARRADILRYLGQARMVVRASGRMPDPITGAAEPVVPLSFRTDGTWVWSDATAYYLATFGIAPELEFLCHLEQRAADGPPAVPDDVAVAAAAATREPAKVVQHDPPRYLAHHETLLRQWPSGAPELLTAELRWLRCPGGWSPSRDELVEITEAEAAARLDLRWSRASN